MTFQDEAWIETKYGLKDSIKNIVFHQNFPPESDFGILLNKKIQFSGPKLLAFLVAKDYLHAAYFVEELGPLSSTLASLYGRVILSRNFNNNYEFNEGTLDLIKNVRNFLCSPDINSIDTGINLDFYMTLTNPENNKNTILQETCELLTPYSIEYRRFSALWICAYLASRLEDDCGSDEESVSLIEKEIVSSIFFAEECSYE